MFVMRIGAEYKNPFVGDGLLPFNVYQIAAPSVALVIATVNGASKKPRFTLNFVSATTPTAPGRFAAPGVGVAKNPTPLTASTSGAIRKSLSATVMFNPCIASTLVPVRSNPGAFTTNNS